MHKYYYVYEPVNKHYEPTCRLLESQGSTLADIQLMIDTATRAAMPDSKEPNLVVTQVPGKDEFKVFNSPNAKYGPNNERYKLVPFDQTLRYTRHKIK